jgi:hypothetical protein
MSNIAHLIWEFQPCDGCTACLNRNYAQLYRSEKPQKGQERPREFNFYKQVSNGLCFEICSFEVPTEKGKMDLPLRRMVFLRGGCGSNASATYIDFKATALQGEKINTWQYDSSFEESNQQPAESSL